MKKRYVRLTAAVISLLTLSGCIAAEPLEAERLPEPTSINTRSKTTAAAEPAVPQSRYERSDFKNGGTIISMEDGKYRVDRLQRAEEKPMEGDKWTVLVYLCGTDLETEYGAATTDLTELLRADCGEDVNIVIQTGGTYEWSVPEFDADRTQRFVNNNGILELVDEFSLVSMAEPDTLSDFISWGAENYPADNMGLILWNHGGGSISGVCFDERFGYDSLTLPELDRALNASYDSMTEKFEFIGFDACLMATLETANILAPYAKYMFASQETEPGGGWDYTTLTSYLGYNSGASGAELGTELCGSYYKHCEFDHSEDNATFSVVDLSKIDALLSSFNDTARELYEDKKFIDIVYAINAADNFGGNNRTEGYSNMVDLGGLLDECEKFCRTADKTKDLLEAAVVCMKNGELHEDATGLSVYYPLAVQGSEELSAFADICPSTYYLAFVDKAAYAAAGNLLVDYSNEELLSDHEDIWSVPYNGGDYEINTDEFASYSTGGSIPVQNVYFTDSGMYTVKLGSADNLKYAACSLFLYESDGSTTYLGSDDDVVYDLEKNLIADNFDGSWLTLDDGQPLPIEVVDQKDDYSIYTCEVLLNGEYTNLRVEYSWDDHEWSIAGAWKGIDSLTGMAHRDFVPLTDGDVIEPVYYNAGDYEDMYFSGDKYTVNGDVGLSYQYLPAGDYAYCMTLYDIFGNWYFTPFAIFNVDYDGSLSYYPDSLVFE